MFQLPMDDGAFDICCAISRYAVQTGVEFYNHVAENWIVQFIGDVMTTTPHLPNRHILIVLGYKEWDLMLNGHTDWSPSQDPDMGIWFSARQGHYNIRKEHLKKYAFLITAFEAKEARFFQVESGPLRDLSQYFYPLNSKKSLYQLLE